MQWGGLLGHLSSGSLNYYISICIESFSIVAVDTFILITGYFSYPKSSIRINKLVLLTMVMIFYGIILSISYFLSRKSIMTVGVAVKIITNSFSQWFVILYCILYLLIPFLNKLLDDLSQKEWKALLLIAFIFFYCWPTFFTSVTVSDHGYGIINFVCLYIVGAYLRRFGQPKMFAHPAFMYLVMTVFTIILSVITQNRAWAYNSPFVLLASVALFVIFLSIRMKYHPLINRLATYTFAVFIIDVNPFFNRFLYRGIFHSNQYWHSHWMIVNLIIATIGVYVICIAIEFLRRLIFGRLFDWITSKFRLTISVKH